MCISIKVLNHGYLVTETGADGEKTREYAFETADSVMRLLRNLLGCSDDDVHVQPEKEKAQESAPEPSKRVLPNIRKEEILIPKSTLSTDMLLKLADRNAPRKKIPGYACWITEFPDGSGAVVGYKGTSYAIRKDAALRLPYPVPYAYFRGSDISVTARTAIRAYRHYLSLEPEAEPEKEGETEEEPEEKCPSDRQEECENRDTDHCKFCVSGSRFEPVIQNEKTKELREMVIRMGLGADDDTA